METGSLEFGEFVDRDTFRLVRNYPHPTGHVWSALTDPVQMKVWWVHFMKLELREGGAFEIDAQGNAIRGVLTACEAPRLIEFGGVTRFELFETKSGCRLELTMKRWANGWSPLQLAGFHAQLDQLRLHLDSVSPADIERRVDTWRHVFPAYELLVRRNINADRQVYYRIHFGANEASLRPDSIPILDLVLTILAENAGMKVEIDGHCDDPCTQAESGELARKRIAAVSGYLEKQGVDPKRMITIGGANGLHRVVSSDSEEGRAFNRRVDLRPIY